MSSGDWGYDYIFYLIKNKKLQTVFSKKEALNTFFSSTNVFKIEIILSELIYDFQKKNLLAYYRKDTFYNRSKSLLISNNFEEKIIKEKKEIINSLKLDYDTKFKMVNFN